MAKIFCTNCGKQIEEGMRFCTDCGTPVNEKILIEAEKEVADFLDITTPEAIVKDVEKPAEIKVEEEKNKKNTNAPKASKKRSAETKAEEIKAALGAEPEQTPVLEKAVEASSEIEQTFEPAAAPPVTPFIHEPMHRTPAVIEEEEAAPKDRPLKKGTKEDIDAPKDKYGIITTGGYIGICLLLLIPVVNLLLLIIWACGGCKKYNKRNLARSALILMLVCLAIAVIAMIVCHFMLISSTGHGLFEYIAAMFNPNAHPEVMKIITNVFKSALGI
ncbi:MAG: zinc-ribbon domain-containing protein [Oscillospiraceae bacterium]